MYLVYKILNLQNGKYYIGCTGNIERRIYEHASQLRVNSHPSKLFQEDYNNNHSFEVGIVVTTKKRYEAEAFERCYAINADYNGMKDSRVTPKLAERTTPYCCFNKSINNTSRSNWKNEIPELLEAVRKVNIGDGITVREDFSNVVLHTLEKRGSSKRWLYLKLKMAHPTFESRIENNDWRIGEIIKITQLLEL